MEVEKNKGDSLFKKSKVGNSSKAKDRKHDDSSADLLNNQ